MIRDLARIQASWPNGDALASRVGLRLI